MELVLFQKHYENNNTIEDFINATYLKSMTYLASDLLAKDVHAEDIKAAVKKAILATEKAGLNSKQHFKPIISVKNGDSFLDCKLTKTGYALVLLNTEPKSKYVARLQLKIAQQVLQYY